MVTGFGIVELISEYGDASLVLLVLGIWIASLKKDISEERKKNESLNRYIRETEKENIKTLSEFGRFLETLIANMDSMKDGMVKEIALQGEHVKLRLDNLKTILESKHGKS